MLVEVQGSLLLMEALKYSYIYFGIRFSLQGAPGELPAIWTLNPPGTEAKRSFLYYYQNYLYFLDNHLPSVQRERAPSRFAVCFRLAFLRMSHCPSALCSVLIHPACVHGQSRMFKKWGLVGGRGVID